MMSDETKKYVGIAIVVACLLAAGTIAYNSFSGGGAKYDGDRKMALMCAECGGFEVSGDEFREMMTQQGPEAMMMPGMGPQTMECPKCGKKSCMAAQKCQKCENIFVFGQAKDQNYPDRCPKCKYSGMEERIQQRKSN